MVDPPTKSRILLKSGTLSDTKTSPATTNDLTTHLFHDRPGQNIQNLLFY